MCNVDDSLIPQLLTWLISPMNVHYLGHWLSGLFNVTSEQPAKKKPSKLLPCFLNSWHHQAQVNCYFTVNHSGLLIHHFPHHLSAAWQPTWSRTPESLHIFQNVHIVEILKKHYFTHHTFFLLLHLLAYHKANLHLRPFAQNNKFILFCWK